MKCSNCSTQVDNNVEFCPNCGNKIERKKSFSSKIIILLVLLVIIAAGVLAYFILQKTENNNENKDNNSNNQTIVESEKLNSLEKIKKDYENGNLSTKDYFTELVYLEFSTEKLNSKYQSDYNYHTSGCEFETTELLENHYDELDENIVKFYLENKLLINVSLGEEKSNVQQSNSSKSSYKVQFLSNEEDKSNTYNHRLNNVYLSSKNNFLIWYASDGEDAITQEQLKLISDTLENSVNMYEQEFGIEYIYSPYVDNKVFNEDWKKAKTVLEQNNMPKDILKTAMSVYVYDTGSDSTLASYEDEVDAKKWINRSLFLDILDEDGIINYPYIVINKRGFSDGLDSLVQLANHELFHHMQYLYCKANTKDRCTSPELITEGMANFASVKVSNVNSTNNYLNNWAGIYTKATSNNLANVANKSGYLGYGIFPYYYSFSQNVSNWAEILMNAHYQEKPFKYIRNNASKEELINTINDLAYYTLSQNYDNKSLISNMGISDKQEINEQKTYNIVIGEGSIDYFKLGEKTELKVSVNNNEYLTIILYGEKNGYYKELKKTSSELEVDTALYVTYDNIYLVVTNGDITTTYSYTIDVKNSKVVKNSEYNTSFKNYNIEVTMHTKVIGIEVESHSKGTVDELHQKEYLDSDNTTLGMTLSSKLYYDFNSGITYMTQPFGGDTWWKEKGTSQLVDLKKILNQLTTMKDVQTVSKNHYKVKMSKKDIEGLMNDAKADTSAIKGDVYVDVYTENGYITKLEYDFSDMIDTMELFTATIEFSNYDKAGDVEIPQVIVDNAKSV